jgi:hypothetical protein
LSVHVKDALPPPPVVAFVQANELNSPAGTRQVG